MKQLTSRDIRCYTVSRPAQKEIENKLQQAKELERTAFCKMVLPDIVTN